MRESLRQEVYKCVERNQPISIGHICRRVWAPRREIERRLYNWAHSGQLKTVYGRWIITPPVETYPNIPAHCLGKKDWRSWWG